MNLPHIPQVISTQPMILLTGFLGAGKTTLLRELLTSTKDAGLVADVILNDYADAALDSSTLEEIAENVEPLTATCACCEGLDFLLELSIKSAKSSSDLLFVELNGTADPVPIVESFTLLEDKLKIHPRWQVCVIDVRNFGQRGAYRDIETLQLQTASHIYLSHTNTDIDTGPLLEQVREINAHASIVSKSELLEMATSMAKAKKRILSAQCSANAEQDPAVIKKPDTHEKTHEFTSCQILLPAHCSENVIRTWLAELPLGVIRAKVLIGISEKPDGRYLFERVGTEISPDVQYVKLGDRVPNSAILIGPDLDLKSLQELTSSHLS